MLVDPKHKQLLDELASKIMDYEGKEQSIVGVLIHFYETDYEFDGEKFTPLDEKFRIAKIPRKELCELRERSRKSQESQKEKS